MQKRLYLYCCCYFNWQFFLFFCDALWCVGVRIYIYWNIRGLILSLPSASNILRYILSCRAIAIYDLPINLRYIYKRVLPLVYTHQMLHNINFGSRMIIPVIPWKFWKEKVSDWSWWSPQWFSWRTQTLHPSHIWLNLLHVNASHALSDEA